MNRILIAYTTNAGSTEEVARVVAEPFQLCGDQVDIRRLEQVTNLSGYDAVIVGAPMILGWHGAARRFLRRHREALARLPFACFCTAMTLTEPPAGSRFETPVALDPGLVSAPARPRRLSIKERYAQVGSYLKPILRAAAPARPVSVAFFGGKLEYFRLKIVQLLFVMLVIRLRPSDLRSEEFMRQWAEGVRPLLVENA